MKKLLISAVLAASLGAVAVANAATPVTSGTITFNGAVIQPTCSVSVNNSGASTTVSLTPYNDTNALPQGSAIGWTPVTLTLSGCGITANATKVYPYFTGSNIDSSNGYLRNTVTAGNGGSNVEIVLSNSQSLASGVTGPLALAASSGNQNIVAQTLPTSGTSTLTFNFYAAYVATATTTTAGSVITSVQYALNYQ